MQHAITDCDRHFEIDPVSRTIKPLNQKTSIVQFDHNSERLTFSIPRYVEGHDMTECTNIEVHYSNIDVDTKGENVGVYPITDMQVDPSDEECAICTWLISQNATQKVGLLKFSIRFTCLDKDANILYSWNTGIFSSIIVLASFHNSGTIAKEYADVLEMWKRKLFDLASNAPRIGESGNWEIYNAENAYVDSGIAATPKPNIWSGFPLPELLEVNTIYSLSCSEPNQPITVNLPVGNVCDFIQVDFPSGETPPTLIVNATSSGLSEFDFVPEANMLYSLYFDYGMVRYDSDVGMCEYGWRFAYAEYVPWEP